MEERAIPLIQGAPSLDDDPKTRISPIEKCFHVAKMRKFDIFAIQDDGECLTGPNARESYRRYGPSIDCSSNGEGGPFANNVYEIQNGKY